MARAKRRRRGTAIVETEQGILVAAGRSGIYLLPGGGANHHETRMQAAMRELKEETGLHPHSAKFLFRHRGRIKRSHGHGHFQDHHTVCLVRATGAARPRHEIRHLRYYYAGCDVPVSAVTREIIDRYYRYKAQNRRHRLVTNWVHRLLDWLSL